MDVPTSDPVYLQKLGEYNDPEFDITIGRLDYIISMMMIYASRDEAMLLSAANRQTLKHHAEDMVAAGQAILGKMSNVKGTPQP